MAVKALEMHSMRLARTGQAAASRHRLIGPGRDAVLLGEAVRSAGSPPMRGMGSTMGPAGSRRDVGSRCRREGEAAPLAAPCVDEAESMPGPTVGSNPKTHLLFPLQDEEETQNGEQWHVRADGGGWMEG